MSKITHGEVVVYNGKTNLESIDVPLVHQFMLSGKGNSQDEA